MKLKQKMKTYSFWVGLSGAVVILIDVIAKNFGLNIESKVAEDIIMAVCGILVAIGVVCAPAKENSKQEGIEESGEGEASKQENKTETDQETNNTKEEQTKDKLQDNESAENK